MSDIQPSSSSCGISQRTSELGVAAGASGATLVGSVGLSASVLGAERVSTAGALAGAAGITRVLVVTDDERIQSLVDASSASWLPEAPHVGLNPAAALGAASLPRDTAVAIIAGDLPCLIPSAIDLVLALAEAHDRAFVSDAQGIGTTMLLDRTAATCTPAFGERSRARHAQLGYVDLGLDVSDDTRRLLARARRDVDTQVDLWDARRMGVGAATRAVLLNGPAR